MSHYNVNGGVPKTLIQHLIRWVMASGQFDDTVGEILQSVLSTEITPELVPVAENEAVQSSEATVGPYPLQDFTLFWVLRYGFRPAKIAFLASHAWSNPARGSWPPGYPPDQPQAYSFAEIRHWLTVFARRFYSFSQFKRSAMPNGPKVSHGGSLSPRGDWRAPSDMAARVWLDEIDRDIPRDLS
jgi:NAD+ synthase (glutamine-hydrolysing)